MHRLDALDREGVAHVEERAVVHGHGLEAVVDVEHAGDGDVGRLRNEVRLRAVRRDRRGAGDLRVAREAQRVVLLVGVEARHHADVRALERLVRAVVLPEGARRADDVAREAVVAARGEREVTVVTHHAGLVHERVAERDVVERARGGADRNDERTEARGRLHERDVDVGGELLVRARRETAFLKRVAELGARHRPSGGLDRGDARRNGELRLVAEGDANAGRTRDRGHDVRLRTPNGAVVRARGRDRRNGDARHRRRARRVRLVVVVDVDVARHHERVVEALEELIERDFLFLAECVGHGLNPGEWVEKLLLRLRAKLRLVRDDAGAVAGAVCFFFEAFED